MHKFFFYKEKGFTLLEVMVLIVILTIFLVTAVPSFSSFIEKLRLEASAESLYSTLSQARIWAIKTDKPVYLTVSNGVNWCYGLSDISNQCDCSASNGCQLDSKDTMVSYLDYKNLTLTTAAQGATITTGSIYNKYDPKRGLPTDAANFTFTSSGNKSISVILSYTGRVNLCSNSFPRYTGC